MGLWAVAERPNPHAPGWLYLLSALLFFGGWMLARGANLQKFAFKRDPQRAFLLPRERDDDRRYAEKYGPLWDEYRKQVRDRIADRSEFQRGGSGVIGAVGFIGRYQVGDIAHHKDISRLGAENGLRRCSGIAAGNDHDFGALPALGKRAVTSALPGKPVVLERTIAVQKRSGEIGHHQKKEILQHPALQYKALTILRPHRKTQAVPSAPDPIYTTIRHSQRTTNGSTSNVHSQHPPHRTP